MRVGVGICEIEALTINEQRTLVEMINAMNDADFEKLLPILELSFF
jgi:hypothetical protein